MRILVLSEGHPDLATIENTLRLGQLEVVAPRGALTPAPSHAARYGFAGWTLDAATRALSGPAGQSAELTSSEFDLLIAFLRHPGQAVSRAELTRALRGRAWTYFDRSIDTLVARLRKKIDLPGAPSLVRSVRSVGYVFCAPVVRSAADP
jgi:two-component system OmpR family response regulator